MGSLSIWHWIVVIAVVLLLFGRGKISDLMGDVAQGIKAFKKGMPNIHKVADKPAEPSKSIEHHAAPAGDTRSIGKNPTPTAARSDVGSKGVGTRSPRSVRRLLERAGARRLV